MSSKTRPRLLKRYSLVQQASDDDGNEGGGDTFSFLTKHRKRSAIYSRDVNYDDDDDSPEDKRFKVENVPLDIRSMSLYEIFNVNSQDLIGANRKIGKRKIKIKINSFLTTYNENEDIKYAVNLGSLILLKWKSFRVYNEVLKYKLEFFSDLESIKPHLSELFAIRNRITSNINKVSKNINELHINVENALTQQVYSGVKSAKVKKAHFNRIKVTWQNSNEYNDYVDDVNETELKKYFGKYGTINAMVFCKRNMALSKPGCAVIEYKNHKFMQTALNSQHTKYKVVDYMENKLYYDSKQAKLIEDLNALISTSLKMLEIRNVTL
ncbi:RNA cognition motif superfamily protein [Malacosoma neustria nucleopolyhedrovirus]|uniref:RNA cognition motif superfamily protein n=1 Tax=Malacosoma neustria nuclear polyhedrosis virus TaxID=38012 RepID=UPI000E360403|nr:RNA cognition motif superfamily protein [Malacosoma neustria nucleopolyhedrovirus]AUF81562.1 RNA cognition motif superfamily protein [Malacosoma neustria nucleopolyhedrovirus]